MNADLNVYTVLDNVTDGLRVQVELQPRVNHSLGQSGIPFIRAIVVHNETGAALAGVELAAVLSVGTDDTRQQWRHTIPGPLVANSVTRIDDPREFDVFGPLLASAAESLPGTLDLTAAIVGGGVSTRILAAIEVSAANEWLNYPGLHAALAAFVQPNTRAVTGILRAASDLLLKRTGSATLEGYQSGPARAHQMAAAIYESIRALGVTYISPPASFERTGQKVRTTEQVLADRFGTCIDLAVLYAACLEAVGLSPVIFITRTHAFSGFYAAETYGERATVEQVNTLTNLVEAGVVVPVELTGIGAGHAGLDFTAATETATRYFRSDFHLLQTMVDVTRARLDGVRPMAGFTGTPGTTDAAADESAAESAIAAERPFVARSSLKNLSAAAEEEVVRGQLDRHDDSPARFKNWKRDLLDLTLRNPLLNMPRTQKVLDLLVPGGMLPMLDDVVHSGKSVRVSGGLDSSELQKLAGVRVASEIAPDVMKTVFSTTRTVFSALADDKHRAQLRAMKREADTLEQESGSNYLYLTLGTLVHQKADGSEARAPLFLLPVRLTGGLAFTPYAMKLDGDDLAQPNLCLLQWLKTTKGLDLTELENPSLDDSGLAIQAVLTGIRRQLLEAELPYRIDESASLAILRFSTFQIWKDLDENWQELLSNPVVRHLVEVPGETFADPAGSEQPPLDETTLRLPIAADGSQMAAIVRATSGQSFVLEGPPGTGKSQTITNLIAHALTAGKKVLFVAEKQAALEVVRRRLDAIGIGGFALELHGAKQSMNSIREQLRAALDTRVASDQAAWDATEARLRAAIVELERYPELVHSTNALGYSLWTAYDATAKLGDGPTAEVAPGWVAKTPTVDVTQATRDLSDAAIRFGLRSGHHWLLSGASDPARLDADALRAAFADLRSARTRVAALSPEWTRALAALLPGAGLGAAVRLATARAAGLLPTLGHLAYIDRGEWREAAEALRQATAAYRATHARALAEATPAALEFAGLGELIEKSRNLDGQWFFPETRRRSLRAQIEPLLAAGTQAEGAEFTALLERLRHALVDAEPLLAAKSRLQGLITPEPWRPYAPASGDELTAAVYVATTAVWLSKHAPAAWALLAEGGPAGALGDDGLQGDVAVHGDVALPGAPHGDIAVLADIDAVWTRWLAALGGTAATVHHWAAAPGTGDWLAKWTADEPLWRADLDATGALQPQRFAETRRLLDVLVAAGLPRFAEQLASVSIPPQLAPEALLRGLARASLEERTLAGGLSDFDSDAHDRAASAYLEQGAASRDHLRSAVAARLVAQRPFDVANLRGEVAELKRQIDRKRGGLAFREVARRYPDALTAIAPVFLMSPGSVAHFLDASSIDFDLVIFDEASQIRVPQAIGAMGRGRAVIVVGDSKQMPPTRIMQVDAAPDGASGATAGGTPGDELVVEDLESILSEAVESGLPQLWLSWHYRSHDESLIAFSNATYYGDKLVSLPSPRVTGAHTGDDAPAPAPTGLSLRRVAGEFARGAARTNEVEAQAIVDEIAARLRDPATKDESIGVVCFNIQQRDLILDKLEDSPDLLVQRALTAEPGLDLFVKNLENVQGDERDTILFSLAFSLDAKTGTLPLNFGPLNLAGGERRLNVAITRARKNVVLFASFDPSDIDLRRSSAQGIADLKGYLEFAASRRLGAHGGSASGGSASGHAASGTTAAQIDGNGGTFVDELAAALCAGGPGHEPLEVATAVGLSSFKVDLAVRRPADDEWRVAVMVDGGGWAARPTVSDRDGAPQLLVDLMGWPATARVWLPAWLRDRAGVLARIREAVDRPSQPKAKFVSVASAVPHDAEPAEGTRADVAATATTTGISLAPFVVADDSVIASQSVLENMRMAQPAIERIAAEVLATEGPIPLTRLVATVARRFGYTRMGEARRNELAAAVEQLFGAQGGFVWPRGIDAATWREARRSPSTAARAISEISPHEIANVIEMLLRESFSMGFDDLAKETVDVLGYARVTDPGRASVARALELAIAENRVTADAEKRLRLA